MSSNRTEAAHYAKARAEGRCVKCPRPAMARLCPTCWLANRDRLLADKAGRKYGREQAREAR
jgi:hypothetical protein